MFEFLEIFRWAYFGWAYFWDFTVFQKIFGRFFEIGKFLRGGPILDKMG